MHFKIETISALPTNISYRKTGRSANHPPVAPLRLQAYRDTAGSLGYPLAVVSLVKRTTGFLTRQSSIVQKEVKGEPEEGSSEGSIARAGIEITLAAIYHFISGPAS